MIARMLVSCPSCEQIGKKSILGEIKDGYLWVLRFHNGYTKIRGEFEIICELCGEPVYFRSQRKELDGTLLNNRIFGLHREVTVAGTN